MPTALSSNSEQAGPAAQATPPLERLKYSDSRHSRCFWTRRERLASTSRNMAKVPCEGYGSTSQRLPTRPLARLCKN